MPAPSFTVLHASGLVIWQLLMLRETKASQTSSTRPNRADVALPKTTNSTSMMFTPGNPLQRAWLASAILGRPDAHITYRLFTLTHCRSLSDKAELGIKIEN